MKLLYITGSHSSRKSILQKSLKGCCNSILFPRQSRKELFSEEEYESLSKNKQNKVAVFKNLSDRLDISVHETKQQVALSKNFPDNFILADHFLLDCMAYILTCFKLNWLTKEEFTILKDNFEKEFNKCAKFDCYGFFLQPSMEKVEKIFTMKNVGSSRFWERKTKFLFVSHESFNQVYSEYIEKTNGKWQILEDENIENQRKIVINTIQ